MSDKLKLRVDLLTALGYTYDEPTRYFKKGKLKIDVDLAQYGTEEQFEKYIKKALK